MIICQISDLHIKARRRLAYARVDTAACLERCVEAIGALDPPPDVVVATGDLVDDALPGDYALLATLLAPLRPPLYLIPGNHDDRAALRSAFPSHRYLQQWDPFVQYAIDDWPVRIVALDTVIEGASGGELCAARLAWLERTLAAAPATPTVIIMHHPPFVTGLGFMDQVGYLNPAPLAEVIARHPQVERVMCGHLHRSIMQRFAGTVASTCPSPAHQVALELAPTGGAGFKLEPPGFQLHWWSGSALVTHTAVIGSWPGPFPFHDMRPD
ncbi:MAG: phosphodiesterase [Proteobacteria bacterium]|nr:phosphodiesterase [Burkholderiales bacterium]